MVKIITDSICDLDPHYLAPYDVDMMPLRVRLGEKEYLDKVDIDYLDVCRAMEQGTGTPSLPKCRRISCLIPLKNMPQPGRILFTWPSLPYSPAAAVWRK